MSTELKASAAPLIHLDASENVLESSKKPAPPRPQSELIMDPVAESRRQEAFDSEFLWRGQALEGFSVSREALFGQLRLAMGAPRFSQCVADPDAFAADAQRILYLCSNPSEVWNRLRSDMATLQSAVDDWADSNITISEKLASETVAMKIWLASQQNRHEPAPSKTPHGDDAGN